MPNRTRAMPLILAVLAAATVACARPSGTANLASLLDSDHGAVTRPSPELDTRYPESAYAGESANAGLLRVESPRARASRRELAEPAALAAALLSEVNRERMRQGSRPLVGDGLLDRAAERYARELASRREIEHVSSTPGLRSFRDRIHATGARARLAGENLARLTAAPGTLPDRTVRAWLRSPGHRANLLDPEWRRSGLGVWLGRDGVWYVVQLYATPD